MLFGMSECFCTSVVSINIWQYKAITSNSTRLIIQPDKIIQVTDMEPEVFKNMIHYLYTGETPKRDEFIEPLFLAEDR
jgi:hypothetical protein